MTWSVNFSGHEQDENGKWDESTEKAIADIARKVVDELKQHGLSSARFNGNYYHEDYIDTKARPES